jgi:hypothetical protein
MSLLQLKKNHNASRGEELVKCIYFVMIIEWMDCVKDDMRIKGVSMEMMSD